MLQEVMGQSPRRGGIPQEGHTPKLGGGADATVHSRVKRPRGARSGGQNAPGIMPQGGEVSPKGTGRTHGGWWNATVGKGLHVVR